MDKSNIKYIVLDVLKPHQPNLPSFTTFIGELENIQRVDATVLEIDDKTESLKIIINGTIDYESLSTHIIKQGAVIKSIDQVIVE